jgi:hypothetical protein
MTTTLDTTNWVSYPFTVNGIKFNSVIDPLSNIQVQVSRVPREVFEQMNKDAVLDIIGNPETLTLSELKNKLVSVNEFATQAVIELAGE